MPLRLRQWKLDSLMICAIGTVPIITTIWMYAFYISARVLLGYWPGYNNPDPKTLSIYFVFGPIAQYLWLASIILLPIWLVAGLTYIGENLRARDLVPFFYSLFGYLLLFFGAGHAAVWIFD